MSTVIKLVPKLSPDKTLIGVGIENDGIIRTRVQAGQTNTDKRFNFSSYPEGTYEEIKNDPVFSVSSEKINTVARYIITVDDLYLSTATEIPQERFVWYPWNADEKNYEDSTAVQTFSPSAPLYVLWRGDQARGPTNPVNAWNPTTESTTLDSLYTKLATTAERRQYLKDKLLAKYQDPDLLAIAMGSSLLTITTNSVSYTSPAAAVPNDHRFTNSKMHARANQSMIFRMEMLTRAISADVNLNTEAKFNLLDGEISLDNWAVFLKVDRSLNGLINPTGNRNGWLFQRLGSMSGSTYTAPSINTGSWTATQDTSINIHSAPPASINNNDLAWLTWLRS